MEKENKPININEVIKKIEEKKKNYEKKNINNSSSVERTKKYINVSYNISKKYDENDNSIEDILKKLIGGDDSSYVKDKYNYITISNKIAEETEYISKKLLKTIIYFCSISKKEIEYTKWINDKKNKVIKIDDVLYYEYNNKIKEINDFYDKITPDDSEKFFCNEVVVYNNKFNNNNKIYDKIYYIFELMLLISYMIYNVDVLRIEMEKKTYNIRTNYVLFDIITYKENICLLKILLNLFLKNEYSKNFSDIKTLFENFEKKFVINNENMINNINYIYIYKDIIKQIEFITEYKNEKIEFLFDFNYLFEQIKLNGYIFNEIKIIENLNKELNIIQKKIEKNEKNKYYFFGDKNIIKNKKKNSLIILNQFFIKQNTKQKFNTKKQNYKFKKIEENDEYEEWDKIQDFSIYFILKNIENINMNNIKKNNIEIYIDIFEELINKDKNDQFVFWIKNNDLMIENKENPYRELEEIIRLLNIFNLNKPYIIIYTLNKEQIIYEKYLQDMIGIKINKTIYPGDIIVENFDIDDNDNREKKILNFDIKEKEYEYWEDLLKKFSLKINNVISKYEDKYINKFLYENFKEIEIKYKNQLKYILKLKKKQEKLDIINNFQNYIITIYNIFSKLFLHAFIKKRNFDFNENIKKENKISLDLIIKYNNFIDKMKKNKEKINDYEIEFVIKVTEEINIIKELIEKNDENLKKINFWYKEKEKTIEVYETQKKINKILKKNFEEYKKELNDLNDKLNEKYVKFKEENKEKDKKNIITQKTIEGKLKILNEIKNKIDIYRQSTTDFICKDAFYNIYDIIKKNIKTLSSKKINVEKIKKINTNEIKVKFENNKKEYDNFLEKFPIYKKYLEENFLYFNKIENYKQYFNFYNLEDTNWILKLEEVEKEEEEEEEEKKIKKKKYL